MKTMQKTKQRILIRTDTSNEIGMGHIFRCKSIATALKSKGYEIHFITSTNVKQFLGNLGVFHISNNVESDELTLIRNIEPEIFIIDLLEKFFPFSGKYFRELRKISQVLISIDYVSKNLKYFDKSFHSLFGPKKFHAKKTYYDLKFAIVRNEFNTNRTKYKIKKKVSSILILSGGSDTYCIGPKILKMLKFFQSNIKITIIIGPKFQCWSQLDMVKSHFGSQLKILHNVKNMVVEMQKHQLAITAAGVSMTELLTIGVPSIIVYGNLHEKEAAELIQKNNLGLNIGYGKTISKQKFLDSVTNLILDFNKRKRLHKNSKLIFDGKGTTRIIQEILTN